MKYSLFVVFSAFLCLAGAAEVSPKDQEKKSNVTRLMATVQLSKEEARLLQELPLQYAKSVNDCLDKSCKPIRSKILAAKPDESFAARMELGQEYNKCFDTCEKKFEAVQKKIEALSSKDSCYSEMEDYMNAGYYDEALEVYDLYKQEE
uniref:Uncharacterized protein n=1 Tax=Trichuris muris TaxID=70415 RepID=A0A5S6QRS6_TRIMR